MLQAPMFDGLAFDPFSLFEDGLCPAEVGVGGRHIIEALVVALVVIVLDERLDLGLGILKTHIEPPCSRTFRNSILLNSRHANLSVYQVNGVRTIPPFDKTILLSRPRLAVARADAELALERPGEIREIVDAD